MGDFGYNRVLDVRHIKCKGKMQKQYLVRWNPSYTTSAECGVSDEKLMKDYGRFEVLGPADVAANKGLTDPKKMIWGVKRTRYETGKKEVQLMIYEDVRKMYVEELADYLMQFTSV